jgi:hypothetical protein
VCDLENLKNEQAMTHVGSQRHKKALPNLFFLELLTVTHLVKIISACLKEIPQIFFKK